MAYLDFRNFVRERDEAFRRAVVLDDWYGVYRYMAKWQVPCPNDFKTLKLGVYKAVRECTGIGDDVKKLAAEKAVAMGFSPSMFEVRRDDAFDTEPSAET